MPPALLSDDESVSDDLDTIPAKVVKRGAKATKAAKAPEPEEEEVEEEVANGAKDDDDDDEDSDDAETFAVEEIITHDFGEKGVVLYKVKWLGYDAEADQTWEPKENLVEGAADILDAYHVKIGGEPKKGGRGPAKGAKRKAESTTASPAPAKRGRKSVNGKSDWQPPAGSWEKEVNAIETISEDPIKDHKGKKNDKLNVFLVFNDGHKAAYGIDTVRAKCPQKLLDYFVSHLTFREPAPKSDDEEVE
ncbi:Chromo domain-containing protein [Elsinoe fawcettii]|nr:Chromo domain-containing protein [Elsinoe fawcettii]